MYIDGKEIIKLWSEVNNMNHIDLEVLVDNIKSDSMSRDEVFYDTGKGVTERTTKFFEHIRTLQFFFKIYLDCEQDIMDRCEDNETDEKEDCSFTSMIKLFNQRDN